MQPLAISSLLITLGGIITGCLSAGALGAPWIDIQYIGLTSRGSTAQGEFKYFVRHFDQVWPNDCSNLSITYPVLDPTSVTGQSMVTSYLNLTSNEQSCCKRVSAGSIGTGALTAITFGIAILAIIVGGIGLATASREIRVVPWCGIVLVLLAFASSLAAWIIFGDSFRGARSECPNPTVLLMHDGVRTLDTPALPELKVNYFACSDSALLSCSDKLFVKVN